MENKTQKPLIIRVSRIQRSLILSMNQENVYRVHFNGLEDTNTLEYETASNRFNAIEAEITA